MQERISLNDYTIGGVLQIAITNPAESTSPSTMLVLALQLIFQKDFVPKVSGSHRLQC